MKTGLFSLFLLVSFICHARQASDIPPANEKVVFTDTLVNITDWDTIKSNVVSCLNDLMKKNKSHTVEDDTINHRILCRTTDYLEIEKTNWSLFALYMQYTLIVQYQQDKIIVSLQNIRYIDYDDIQNNTNNPTVYSAEYVLVEKKYTSAFIKNASDKIADKTKDRFNELFTSISSK
jgi:hypothetical protein